MTQFELSHVRQRCGALFVLWRALILDAVCTLALFHRTSRERPVVIAANRDEFYDRPTAGPAVLASDPWVVAGRDLVAGGTWLGLNAHGLVAGLLNRRTATAIDPTRRSRGQLCLDALRHDSVAAAAAFVVGEPADRYNPFNLLLASPVAACVVGNISGAMVRQDLAPGVHLLTNLDLNDFECPRLARSHELFNALVSTVDSADPETLCAALRGVLADHATPLDPRTRSPLNNLCVHTDVYGTRSSTIIVAAGVPVRWRMWYAPGPPCQDAPEPVALPEKSR
ncbi:NRDE family protein [Candidatus Binatia bacterium]|nr:NRDE family protein [Candidatus Binatia bacterium]